MKSNALGKRYAGALISIGQKDNQFEKYGSELREAVSILSAKEVWQKFTSPLLPVEAKIEVVDILAEKGRWSQMVENFLKVLINKKRIGFLPSIVEAYTELADEVAGRVHVTVESAKALDDQTNEQLIGKLAKMLDKEILMESTTDPELIGGLKIKVGSKVLDGTIRGQLTRMKEFLTKD